MSYYIVIIVQLHTLLQNTGTPINYTVCKCITTCLRNVMFAGVHGAFVTVCFFFTQYLQISTELTAPGHRRQTYMLS